MSVISPCIGVCRINRDSHLCEGCRRTLTEIAEWLHLSDDQKRAVIAALPGRDPQAAMATKPARNA
jgi:predicted Fe-S protein YdhL (DUF1289 family)